MKKMFALFTLTVVLAFCLSDQGAITQDGTAKQPVQNKSSFQGKAEITKEAQASIDKGIKWMIKNQNTGAKDVDGSWG